MNDFYNSTNTKSLDSYMGFAPLKILKGKGVEVYDESGRKLLDCGMALGSVSLGYAYDLVDDFVINEIRNGVNFSRPSHLEEKLTYVLQNDIGKPILARYSKSSSMLMNVIPRICRYLTNREYIAYPETCFLGNTDWYFSRNVKSGGVLTAVKAYTLNFKNGDCESITELFKNYGSRLACIIMEPYRDEIYKKEFYDLLSNYCLRNGVLLVFDETVTGYRFAYPLAQKVVGCQPDFTIIGKAFANGYALSAVVASLDIISKVEFSCLNENLFDFSTTHAGETVGLSAAIKTLEIYTKNRVVSYINSTGEALMSELNSSINKFNLNRFFSLTGQPAYFKIFSPSVRSHNLLRADIIKFFYDRNILFRGIFSLSFSHNKTHIENIASVFFDYCKGLDQDKF